MQQRHVAARSLDMTVGHLGLVNLALVPVSSVLGGMIGGEFGWSRPLVWMGVALLCSIVTVIAIGTVASSPRLAAACTYVASALGALVVGFAPAVPPESETKLVGVMLLVPMTWTSVFVAVAAARRAVFIMFAALASGIAGAVLFTNPDASLRQLGAVVVPYLVFLLILHHVIHRTTVDNIALQLELERLTDELDSERRRLGELNDQLEVTNGLLEHNATHDALCDTLNRRGVQAELERMLLHSAASPVDLLYVDLDGFKEVNDSLGHHRGDATLLAVADILRACVGNDGIVGRYGGDEFVVAVPRARTSGQEVAERILAGLNSAPGVLPTASIGLASAPAHGSTASELIRNADAALNAAKKTGRNRLVEAPLDHPTSFDH
jgi:diguanylate cyclase (GGDEF)-like protein